MAANDVTDENLWLEDIHGSDAIAWAEEQSARTIARFESSEFDSLAARLLDVIDSDERVPLVSKRGPHYYNFWRDRQHPRGLWRRTTLESYRSAAIEWEVLLDVDALGRAEGTEWVFAGAKLLPHDYSRALVSLSPDGGDAVTVREFSLDTLEFVANGFVVPTAKSVFSWIDRNTIYLGTDFGPGSMTDSSYPRTVRRWRRGDSLEEAVLVHEVTAGDLEVVGIHQHTPGF
ncbi:MAG: prolyl oligopeptidase, partial [Microbacteriaceae bacterium]|nr:prolyl oligopeptidase [Microbacteriaceae bacterium]